MNPRKSVLIFGPGKYFGLQLAKRFGSEGFHVVLVSRTEDSLSKLCEALNQSDVSCSYIVADVASRRELAQSLRTAAESIPPVGTVIFNVKASIPGNGLTLAPEALTSMLALNVSGVLTALQASIPFLSENASIILTGGGYKDVPDPEKLGLSVSKGALHTLFLALIDPLRQQGLRISTVIIDGAVREEGPIFPHVVAEAFWKASIAASGDVIRVT